MARALHGAELEIVALSYQHRTDTDVWSPESVGFRALLAQRRAHVALVHVEYHHRRGPAIVDQQVHRVVERIDTGLVR